MKKIILNLIVLFLWGSFFSAEAKDSKKRLQENDTVNYITVSAKVVDKESTEPVVFATVFKTGTSVGTVTNSDGEFILKIPGKSTEGTISFNHLGYKNKEILVKNLLSDNNKVELERHSIPIEEVVIKSLDAKELIETAVSKIKDNYRLKPEMQTGFYREIIKQNRHYVSISEAVLDIYNSGYHDNFDFDRVRIYKGRKSKDVKKMDTVLVKFQGGPRTAMFVDLVKNPGVILDPELFSYYKYTLEGVVSINNKNNYIVKFAQRSNYDELLYEGTIYIDVESYAITGVDFRIAEKSLDGASRALVKKKPLTMKMDVVSGNYQVKFREIDDKWVLNMVRSEVVFKSKWDKKLFKSNITTMFEMAITDRDTEHLDKFPYKTSAKLTDVLADQVTAFEDNDFWGEYNTIKPDESIQEAIKKLNKKIKRQ